MKINKIEMKKIYPTMQEDQKKHHVTMQQYTSMARKQLRFQTMVMVVVMRQHTYPESEFETPGH